MDRPAWYLLAYDVTNPKRLKRLHHRLKRKGLAAQRSVFFVRRSEEGLRALLAEIETIIHRREDDLRVYPIRHPGEVWFRGKRPFSGSLISPRGAVGEIRPGGQPAQDEQPDRAGLSRRVRQWVARLHSGAGRQNIRES